MSALLATLCVKQAFGDVRLVGRMGPTSPTNLGGVGRLTEAAERRFWRRADGPVSVGSCACPVVRTGHVPFLEDRRHVEPKRQRRRGEPVLAL